MYKLYLIVAIIGAGVLIAASVLLGVVVYTDHIRSIEDHQAISQVVNFLNEQVQAAQRAAVTNPNQK